MNAAANIRCRAELTGKGTPVTEESFATWKAQRKTKKEVEEEARLAKEATGRAMFEKGGWQNESGDEESDDDEEEEAGGDFDLQALLAETRRLENGDEDISQLKSYGSNT